MSVTKLLIVYACYFIQGEAKTSFLQISELRDCKAVTTVSKISQICDDLQLDLQKLCGLGSDGASVMLGVRGDVSTLLKEEIPFLVANHCIAHRLALACAQAAKFSRPDS